MPEDAADKMVATADRFLAGNGVVQPPKVYSVKSNPYALPNGTADRIPQSFLCVGPCEDGLVARFRAAVAGAIGLIKRSDVVWVIIFLF